MSSQCASPDGIHDRVKQRRSSDVYDSRGDKDDPAPLLDHVDLDSNRRASSGYSDSENDEAALPRGPNRNQVLPLNFITAYDHMTSGTVGNSYHLFAALWTVVRRARTKFNTTFFPLESKGEEER